MDVSFLGHIEEIRFAKVNPAKDLTTDTITVDDPEILKHLIIPLKKARRVEQEFDPQAIHFMLIFLRGSKKPFILKVLFQHFIFTQNEVYRTETTELWENLASLSRDKPMRSIPRIRSPRIQR